MFAILVLLFRDFLQPLTILFTLPLSLIGAIPALWLIGAALDLPAIIGMLMLMGIVTKNAILLVDFTINSMKGDGPACCVDRIGCGTREADSDDDRCYGGGDVPGSDWIWGRFRISHPYGCCRHRWFDSLNTVELDLCACRFSLLR